MDDATGKKLKIGIAVVLFGGAIGYWQYSRPRSPLDADISFVCVQSGKTYYFDRKDVIEIPMQNPDTGERTLMPTYESEGITYVSARFADRLKDLAEANRYVDPATRKVKDAP